MGQELLNPAGCFLKAHVDIFLLMGMLHNIQKTNRYFGAGEIQGKIQGKKGVTTKQKDTVFRGKR
jgi:hypothetical protein